LTLALLANTAFDGAERNSMEQADLEPLGITEASRLRA
jgi:hypothetical protein